MNQSVKPKNYIVILLSDSKPYCSASGGNRLSPLEIAQILKKMWEPDAAGKATKRNQIRPECPDAPIKLFVPGVDSRDI